MNSHGRGRQGSGSNRSNTRNSTEPTVYNKEKHTKVEFTPHTAGKHESVTYDTVREKILQ